jgi:hypothetical protein
VATRNPYPRSLIRDPDPDQDPDPGSGIKD